MKVSNNAVSYSYIYYTVAFHMKYKHLFVSDVYDQELVSEYPLIITWAETDMKLDEESGKCLAVATKTRYYLDEFKVSEDVFTDMLQAFFIYPEDDTYTNDLKLEFAKAILTQ